MSYFVNISLFSPVIHLQLASMNDKACVNIHFIEDHTINILNCIGFICVLYVQIFLYAFYVVVYIYKNSWKTIQWGNKYVLLVLQRGKG